MLLQDNPGALMARAGLTPDPWQERVLRSAAARLLLLCSRQVGKTRAAAALVLKTAVLEAPALVLILSPSERQSGEFVSVVKALYEAQAQPRNLAGPPRTLHETMLATAGEDERFGRLPAKVRESALQLHLTNGSRVVGLPASEATIRCYSGVSLLVIDEASRVSDDLYRAVRPMLATSGGRLVCLSTPFGKRGWFWEEWNGPVAWERIRVRADECPRIPRAFLAEERQSLGARWYRQEYECSFEEAVDAVFDSEAVRRALVDLEPWR